MEVDVISTSVFSDYDNILSFELKESEWLKTLHEKRENMWQRTDGHKKKESEDGEDPKAVCSSTWSAIENKIY